MKNAFQCLILLAVSFVEIISEEKSCVCSIWGTQLNSVGTPIYNEECDCKCKENVVGKKCNDCKNGFYNFKSGNGCSACLCNEEGSRSKICDKTSGECPCFEGFSGHRCNKCKPDHYRKSSTDCAKCECNIFGSKDLQCDESGTCPCHKNVIGKKCDSCKEFTHDIKKRCIDCPECYENVNKLTENLKKALTATQDLIKQSINEKDDSADENFIKKFQKLAENVNHLLRSVKKINSIDINTVQDMSKKAIKLQEKVKKYIEDVKSKNHKLENVVAHLDTYKNNMENVVHEFEESVLNASNLSKNNTNQDERMKNMANQSRSIYEEIENDIKLIKKMLDETQTACQKTCASGRLFEENRKELRKKLDDLNYSQAQNKIQNLKTHIGNKKRLAQKYKDSDLENREKLKDLILPNVQGVDIIVFEDQKLQNISNDLEEFQIILLEIDETLKNGETLRENTDNVFEEAKYLDQTLTNDIKQMNDLIDNFQNISSYNKTLQRNKAEFEEKWKEFPLLRSKVDSIQGDIKTLEEEIENSKKCIEKFKEHIAKRQNDIKNAQSSIDKFYIITEQLETELDDVMEGMTIEEDKLSENENLVKRLLEQTETQHQHLNQIREQLNNIKENDIIKEYQHAENTINKVIQKALDIISFLKILPTDDDEFEEIEMEVDLAEHILRLKIEIEYLRIEVKNIEEIKKSLNDIDAKKNLCLTTSIEQKGNSYSPSEETE